MNNYKYNNKPLISIITVVYNGERFIEDAIISVINQTYDNIEYIIIDGGSIDKTIDIIKKYDDKISYWVSEPDKGIYDAWNKGIKKAKGDWIGFLGADDFYLNDAIENYVNKIKFSKIDNIMYISSKNILCKENKDKIRTIGKRWNWNDFRIYMTVAHVGSLHNKKFFEHYGLYDTEFKICSDYEMLLRAGKNLVAEFLNKETCFMRDGGVSSLGDKAFLETFEIKKKHKTRNMFFLYFDIFIARLKYKIRATLL